MARKAAFSSYEPRSSSLSRRREKQITSSVSSFRSQQCWKQAGEEYMDSIINKRARSPISLVGHFLKEPLPVKVPAVFISVNYYKMKNSHLGFIELFASALGSLDESFTVIRII
jgi:hypothetical protein